MISKSLASGSGDSRAAVQPSPLKRLRESRGLTQRQVSEYVGVTIQTISNIEREGYVPKLSLGQFSKLCSLFELSIHELAALWEIDL